MKKYSSTILNFCLIVTVSLATVLCCPFSAKQAMATSGFSVNMSKAEKAMPACHSQRPKADATKKGDCSCCLNKQLQADQLGKISFNSALILSGYAFLNVLPQSLVLKTKFNLAYLDGPPGPISPTPHYIHFHNFRI